MNQDATQKTWTTPKGKELPLFPFDQPQIITLPNGTAHHFRMPDETTEKRREDLLKTIVVSAPTMINGERPTDAKTDFTRSAVAYYDMMVTAVSGVKYNGNEPDAVLDVQQETSEILPDGSPAKILDLISLPVKRAAAVRLYGGRVDIESPDDAEDEEAEMDFDPFAPDDESIRAQVEKAEKRKSVYQLTLERSIAIKQQLGIEEIQGTGRFTDETHYIRYTFREPTGAEYSKWELRGFRGFALNLKKGGTKEERYYNLETMRSLFDSMIERIEGASINGNEIHLPSNRDDVQRQSLLAVVPLSIKKITVATLFSELSRLGNV